MRRVLSFLAALLFLAPTTLLAGTSVCVMGAAGAPLTATITFTPPTTNTDGSPVITPLTYDVFYGLSPSSLTSQIDGVKGSPVVISTGLEEGTTVYFDVVAVDGQGTMSQPSNVVCKTFPGPIPNTVTIKVS